MKNIKCNLIVSESIRLQYMVKCTRLMRWRVRKFFQYIAVVILTSTLTYSILNIRNGNFEKWRNSRFSKPIWKLNSQMNLSLNFPKMIYNTVEKSVRAYMENCLGEDEYRPQTKQCLNSFGFSATLVESLETLLWTNNRELYKRVALYLKENFDCENLTWVNRHELWSRAVGSFIGTYIMTGDDFFLTQATKCAIIASNYTVPIMNIKEGKIKKRSWMDEPVLVDYTIGLPELISLSKLTNNTEIRTILDNVLDGLPEVTRVTSDDGNYTMTANNITVKRLDGLSVSFFNNLAIAYTLDENEKIEHILDNVAITAWTGPNVSILYPIVNALDLLKEKNLHFHVESGKKLVQYAINEHLAPRYNAFAQGDSRTLLGFKFDATVLNVMLRRCAKLDMSCQYIHNVITYSLAQCEQGNGYSGLRHSNAERIVFDNVQHSAFTGSWLKIAAILAAGMQSFARDAVFNERGHLLWSKSLI